MDKTTKINFEADAKTKQVREVLETVIQAHDEKGYNPISQLTGYLMTGDPTYMTTHNDARKIIRRVERDEIIEVLIQEVLVK